MTGVYRPPDFDPDEKEQYRTVVGVDPSWDVEGPWPKDYIQHQQAAFGQAMEYLLSIGDLD